MLLICSFVDVLTNGNMSLPCHIQPSSSAILATTLSVPLPGRFSRFAHSAGPGQSKRPRLMTHISHDSKKTLENRLEVYEHMSDMRSVIERCPKRAQHGPR